MIVVHLDMKMMRVLFALLALFAISFVVQGLVETTDANVISSDPLEKGEEMSELEIEDSASYGRRKWKKTASRVGKVVKKTVRKQTVRKVVRKVVSRKQPVRQARKVVRKVVSRKQPVRRVRKIVRKVVRRKQPVRRVRKITKREATKRYTQTPSRCM